jgi:hypothetical protein
MVASQSVLADRSNVQQSFFPDRAAPDQPRIGGYGDRGNAVADDYVPPARFVARNRSRLWIAFSFDGQVKRSSLHWQRTEAPTFQGRSVTQTRSLALALLSTFTK